MRVRIRRSRSQGGCLALAVVALIGIQAHRAQANSTGKTGYSGKLGFSCTPTCHIGGVAPAVSFEGPGQVAAGAVATFRFVVQSQQPASQIAAGLDVAASAGKLGTVSGQGEQLLGGEITHTTPKDNDANGVASWEFTWQAPAQSGTATLFGAGNSVNLNSSSFGDAAAATTLQVVVGDVSTPTPTDTPTELPTEAPTPTPTTTVTPAVGGCVGDCDGNGEVTVNEIISGVNIALGNVDVSLCPRVDANHDGEVTVNELLQAVNAALNGCPPPGGQ